MNKRLAGLSAVAVLLGGYLVWQTVAPQWHATPDDAAQVDIAPRQPGQVPLHPLQGLDVTSFAAVLERPLFNPGRRPRPPAPEPVPEPVAEPPVEQPPPPPQGPGPEDYALLGVASGPAGRVAAVRVTATAEVVYLREGEPIDGWSVIAVGDRSVAIGTAADPVTFRMFEQPPATGAPDASVPFDTPSAEPLPAGVQ